METYDLQYFSTPESLEVLRTKRYGKNIVPFGTYFDIFERYDGYINRLNNDIFPILKIIEALVVNRYEINSYSISYSGDINYKNFDRINLYEFITLCKDHFRDHHTDHFNVSLNINIQKELIFWNTQLDIYTDSIKLQDEEATEDYPVYYLNISGHKKVFIETIDDNFGSAIIDEIVKWAMALIESDYNYAVDEYYEKRNS
jgi:hypothetical protein